MFGITDLLSFFIGDVADPFNLKNAVERAFLAKTPRAQRTYSKNKSHPFGPFGEAIDHLDFDSNLCISWRLCALAVEV